MERAPGAYRADRFAALTAAVEVAEDGLSVTDYQGGMLYQSSALVQLLGGESQRNILEDAIADARNAVTARLEALRVSAATADSTSLDRTCRGSRPRAVSLTLRVRTATTEYRVRTTVIDVNTQASSEPLHVLWLRKCRPRQLPPAALREHYELTSRQVRVAILIAAGSRSREIAQALGISHHTARRHAEAVLRKLGVHSRAEVRERLMGP
jgi:DNA-binding CsgD family transcriptional regulator